MAGRWWLGVVLAGTCGVAAAQGGGSAAGKDAACVAAKGKEDVGKGCPAGGREPSVAEQFPFPGEAAGKVEGKGGKEQFPYPGEGPGQAPGEASGEAPKAGKGAGDRFPYPGEAPAAAGGSSSSSSAAAGGAADGEGKPALKDEGSEGEAQPQHRRRLRPPAQKTLSDEERVEEDLTVAHFYLQSGNAMGAYLRAKDAVKLQPGVADTHLTLGLAAEKLGKREEAVAEYSAAVAADPDGEGAKGAKKALGRLKP